MDIGQQLAPYFSILNWDIERSPLYASNVPILMIGIMLIAAIKPPILPLGSRSINSGQA
jgi:hypothetical protein